MKNGLFRRAFGRFGKGTSRCQTSRLSVENLEARQLLAADVVINELVASNQTTLETLAGKTPDWIELYNRGNSAADLEGWQLRDRGDIWTFPAGISIEPDQYLVVFASGDNQVINEPSLEIHTNFKLSKDGEYLGLLQPDEVVVHEFNPYPDQVNDGAYGLAVNDNFAQYFATATPGAENPPAPNVFITEFMSSNQGTLADEDGDFADWIELYNAGDAPANMDGWSMRSDGIRWEFPDVVIEPNGYLVVFASGNDRREADQTLHTNFKLGSNEDELFLYRTDGAVASRFFYPPQRADVSYGLTVGFAETQFFTSPTPGAENVTDYEGVRFNLPSGYYWEGQLGLVLSTEAENATIRYTLNGTQPTESNGTLYEGSFPLNQSSVVRAATFRDGLEPVESTRSYLMLNSVLAQTGEGLPDTWGFISDYEMDQEVVAANPGSIQNALARMPAVSLTVDPGDLFSINEGIFANPLLNGEGWEHPINVEFIGSGFNDSRTTSRLGSTGTLRVAGVPAERTPASTSKFSMEIFFDEILRPIDTGTQLFDSKSEEFSGILLRAGHADSWLSELDEQRNQATYARDQFILDSFDDMGHSALASKPVGVYINGLFWGVYHMTERPDAKTVSEHLGGQPQDYEVIDENGPIAGNSTAWDRLIELANEDLSDQGVYDSVANLVDTKSLIDFIILKRYAGIRDDAQGSWYAARNADDRGEFQFFFYNNEESMGLQGPEQDPNVAPTSATFYAPEFLYQQMSANAGFRREFGDRVQKHLTGNGALTDQESQNRWNDIRWRGDDPLNAESARWGDYWQDVNPNENAKLFTFEHAEGEAQSVHDNFITGRSVLFLEELRANELFPEIESPTPSTLGGVVEQGFRLQLQATAGSIYYTTDDSDPLLVDGTLAPTAQLYQSPIPLQQNTIVKYRALEGKEWSALTEGKYLIRDGIQLRITEIMYHPQLDDPNSPYDDDDFEFIELQNVGPESISLDGLEFNIGIDFKFKDGSVRELGAHEFVLVVKNKQAFSSRYDTQGLKIAGEYLGQLNNGGERIRLEDSFGQNIESLSFSDQWFSLTDGSGFSIIRTDPTTGPGHDFYQFEASQVFGGTPGVAESTLPFGSIVINEVLTNPAEGENRWIEIHNTTNNSIDIGGWYVSDSSESLRKYKIPANRTLRGGEFLVLMESADFGNDINAQTPFRLDAAGGSLFLTSSNDQGRLGGYREQIEFNEARPETSIGRIAKLDGTVDYVTLTEPTKGTTNTDPFVGPVIINEIMHSPVFDAEYIELLNVTDQDVNLFDPFHPDQTWKLSDGVKFKFPSQTTIPAGAFALVVKSDPEIFRERNNVGENVIVLGPYQGALSNEGEAISLQQATSTGVNDDTTFTVVDRVVFDDIGPWPATAKTGSSLQRRASNLYANDVANWMPSFYGGTPGSENVGVDQTPRSLPYVENFSAATIDQLQGWQFTAGISGRWDVIDQGNFSVLRGSGDSNDCRVCGIDDFRNEAILALNIEDDSKLGMQFTTESTSNDLTIEVSQNQREWYPVIADNIWSGAKIAFDLSGALEKHGIEQQGIRYVKFSTQYAWSWFEMRDIAVATADVSGPWIAEHSFDTNADGNLESIEIVFDEPIDPATFTDRSFKLVNPIGENIASSSITSTDNLHWNIEIPTQTLAGSYHFELSDQIKDASGNRLNPSEFSIDGRSPTEQLYTGTFLVEASSPAGFHSTQDFESGNIQDLNHWEFASGDNASWRITDQGGPKFGSHHLALRRPNDRSDAYSSGDLLFDLSGQSNNATDLSLDFWTKAGGLYSYFSLEVSDGGREWKSVSSMEATSKYEHHSYDLDEVLDRLGVDRSGEIRLRFGIWAGNPTTTYFDNIRISNVDVFGPSIETASELGEPQVSVSSFEVTFDEPIDAASLTIDSVAVDGPVGNDVPVDSITRINDQKYRINFPEQTTPGVYSYTLSSSITDIVGNPMNQNGNSIGGQEDDVDGYLGDFSVRLMPTHQFPYQQSFENDSILEMEGWAFATRGPGAWNISRTGAREGEFALLARQNGPGIVKQSATLSLDLADQANADRLSLSFWAKSNAWYEQANLYISDDGDRWHYVTNISADSRSVFHSIDLRSAMLSRGIDFDEDVRLMFEYQSSNVGNGLTLDDVQINYEDILGPRIVSQSGVQSLDNNRRSVTVAFNKPIDASSFGKNDVKFSMSGNRVTIDEIVPIDDRSFSVIFDTSAAGFYDLQIGPNILGTNGIPMNQFNDAFSGTSYDQYVGNVFIPLEPETVPYFESFSDNNLISLEGWLFSGNRWQTTTGYEPLDDRHISASKFGDCWEDFVGTVALDMTPYIGLTDLILEFDMKRTSKSGSDFSDRDFTRLLLGDSISSLTQVGTSSEAIEGNAVELFRDINGDGIVDLAPSFGEYTHYKFDLDQMIRGTSAEGQSTVTLQFLRVAFYASDVTVFDNINVYSESDVVDGVNVSSVDLQTVGNANLNAVEGITIRFNEPVNGFDVNDLQLTLDGGANLLPGNATLTTTDSRIWQLSNLDRAINLPGAYSLILNAETAGITGSNDGTRLATGFERIWQDVRSPGDANLDGVFDSSDLVAVFQAGRYEDGDNDNSSWAGGDWNGDFDFSTGDLVAAFQSGDYVAAATVDRIASAIDDFFDAEFQIEDAPEDLDEIAAIDRFELEVELAFAEIQDDASRRQDDIFKRQMDAAIDEAIDAVV